MAHALYLVEGLIIRSSPLGESNKTFLILTDQLGLIKASAQAIRDNKSKLRGHLQVGFLSKIELVRGREIWRIVGARDGEYVLPKGEEQRQVLARVARLVQRLVPLDECNPSVYKDLIAGLKLLTTEHDLLSVETVLVLRLLYNLGYFNPAPQFNDLVNEAELGPAMISNLYPHRSEAIKLINESLAGGHL